MKHLTSALVAVSPNRVIKFLTALGLMVMTFGTLWSAYLRQGYSETISFFVQDGWCETGSEGFGAHCFGDLYAPMSIASNPDPWSQDFKLAYTPLNFAYFRLLNSSILGSLGSHTSLVINIVLTIAALAIPGLYIWRHQTKFAGISGLWVLLISLTSAPSIIMLDRGSSSFLLFPLVFFFYRAIYDQRYTLATLTVTLMSLWKPQTAILTIGILIFFGSRRFIKSICYVAFSFLCSFLLYPTNLPMNLTDWLKNSSAYQNYVPIPTPGNYSFVNFIGFLKGGMNLLFFGAENLQDAFRPPLAENVVSLISIILALTFVVLILLNKKWISLNHFTLISSIFLLTIPGTTFGYYLTLMLIPLFVLDRNLNARSINEGMSNLVYGLYLLLLFLMIPPWPFNWGNLPIEVGSSWATLGVHWMLVHFVASIIVLLSILQLIQLRILGSTRFRRS